MHAPQLNAKHRNMSRLLVLPDKGINSTKGVGGVVSRLFRQVLVDLNIDPALYNSLMASYVNDPRNGISPQRKDRSSVIGNFNKEFSKPAMTWKKFVEGLKLLQFEGEIEITLKGTSRISKKESTHHVRFNLGKTPKELTELETEKELEGEIEVSVEASRARGKIKTIHKTLSNMEQEQGEQQARLELSLNQ